MPKHTNKSKALSPLLLIAYSDLQGTRANYPTAAQKNLLLNGAAAARRIMRTAVAEMDRVVFFRRPEGQTFTNIVNYHFGLAANRANPMLGSNVVDKPFSLRAVGEKNRRTILNRARMGMLSVSFHLNTGCYLIDIDAANRTIVGRQVAPPNTVPANTEGYVAGGAFDAVRGLVQPHMGLLSGFRNGEIHLSFEGLQAGGYTAEGVARVIIHEAFHKYWAAVDRRYAWDLAPYRALNCEHATENADSFAWAAVSFDQGALVHGVNSNDFHHQLAAVP